MRKYTILLIAFFIATLGKTQIKIQSDSISLDVNTEDFRKKNGSEEFYEFVHKKNEIVKPHGNSPKAAPKTVKSATPAMSPMSLSQIPYNYIIDKTKGVGEITIQSSVENGAAKHKVPIDIYASIGLKPEIALSYNSFAENSEVGYGWSLEGVSCISVTHSNYYFDGANYKPLQLNKAAAFTLDGIRLIKLSETSSQITYQSEQGNIKVVSYIPSGRHYFDVYYPDGRIGTFGYTTNTSSFKIFYPLTKLKDAQGGFIDYTYTEENNIYYLTGISYGKINTKIGSVSFVYKLITDSRIAYIGGRLIKNTKLLSEIKSYFQSTLLRTYTLTHEANQYNFLTKISCKSGTQELNPLLFYYGSDYYGNSGYFQTDMALLESYFANSKAPDLVLNKGKFNSQTTSDGLIAYPRFDFFGVSGYDNKGNCTYESRYSTTQNLLIFKNLGDFFCTPQKVQTGRGFQGLYPVDYNGDGDDELVRVNYWLENNNQANMNITTYDKNMTARTATFLLEGTFAEGGRHSAVPRTFITGNFLGNGKTQLIAVSSYKMPQRQNGSEGEARSWSRTTMIDMENRNKVYDSTPFKFDYFKDVVFAIDYDGDGRTDICLINENGTYIYSYQDNTFKQIAHYASLKRGDITGSKKKELLVGDINGDGLTDFLLSPKKNDTYQKSYKLPCNQCNGCRPGSGGGGSIMPGDRFPIVDDRFTIMTDLPSPTIDDFSGNCYNPQYSYYTDYSLTHKTWTILLNTGTTFASSTFDFLSNSIGEPKFILEDINGDRLSDLVVKDNTMIRAYLNNNGSISTTAETATIQADKDSHFITGGIGNGLYGSGRPSHILSIKDAIVTPITFSRNDARERMLTGVINSLGVVTQYNYSNLTSGNNYWTITSNTVSFPLRKLYLNMNVVGSTYTYANNENVDSKTYYYNDAVIHTQGGGFKGFSKIMMYDNIARTQMEIQYDPTKFGVPINSKTPTTEITYNYSVITNSNKTGRVLLNTLSEKDKLNNQTKTTTYGYDSYGNPTSETIDFGNGLKASTSRKFAYYTDKPYFLGIPTEVLVSNYGGSDVVTTKTLYTYNASFQLLSKKGYHNNNLVSEEAYTYDGSYNVSTRSQKAYSSTNWLQTKFTYDSFGRVVRETNPMGMYLNNSYNSRGELISSKDQNGLSITYEYDNWGVGKKVVRPDGIVSTHERLWSNVAGIYLVRETKTGKPESSVYYDGLNREVRKGSMRFNGSYLYSDVIYDSKGRVEKTSLPFKGTAPQKWNVYSYDEYDRLLSLTYATGKKDTYSYAVGSVTSVIDGVSTKKVFNRAGQLLSSTDSGGTITYKYRPDGKTSAITSPNGTYTTKFEYDSYGRRTKLIDLSTGTKTFSYDMAGNVSQETDAASRVIKYTYDTYNRLTKKEFVGVLTTAYAYNGNNQKLSETNSNGTSKVYTYDSYQRVTTEKETALDNKWLIKKYTYATGNIASIAYSSATGDINTENFIYTYGNLSEIKLNGNVSVWKLTKENDLGQAYEYTTGALTRTNGYNEFGTPTSKIAKKGNTVIQNFAYNIDSKTGNVSWRKDVTRNLQENFTYDNLNRLTGFGSTKIIYDYQGNITDNTAVGKFEYNANRPHAVSMVTPYGNSVPLRNQDVSYNAMMRPSSISENGYTATLSYNGNANRVKMQLKKNNTDQLIRYYIGGRYEADSGVAGTKEKLYLGGDYYAAVAVLIKEGTGAWNLHFICRDYLGSITHITDANGMLKQELSYDAWGRLRNPSNQQLYGADSQPTLFLGRGYTGHEHLNELGLINMNARLYDPVLGRFLSPDPYVQNPSSTQNLNRYSYCLNNPLRYNDPNGEFIFGVINFVKDMFTNLYYVATFQPAKINFHDTAMGFKVDLGLLKGNPLQILSRFTWELPQSLAGYMFAGYNTIIGNAKSVTYYGGATVVETYSRGWGAVTLGSFITGQRGIQADPLDWLFQHEYGHYLQSQAMGWSYLSKVGIPSIISAKHDGTDGYKHDYHPVEQDANSRAIEYFTKHEKDKFLDNDGILVGWEFSKNPVHGYNQKESYGSDINTQALQNVRIKGSILDFAPYLWGPILSLGLGFVYQDDYGYPMPPTE